MRFRRILTVALRSASLLTLLLISGILLNVLLFGYALVRMSGTDGGMNIVAFASALSENDRHELPAELQSELIAKKQWLLLIDGQGDRVWSFQAPLEIPEHYTLAEVAGFTRWYLMGYPVRVRAVDDGLLILGQAKNTVWKYSFEAAQPTVLFWPLWALVVLILNFILVMALSVGMTARAYRKRDEARTEWIAAVSHDVRTPLSTVLGYAGSLEADARLPEKERGQAGLIREKAMDLKALIEDLNLTNRLEHSMEPLDAEWLPLASVVRESAARFLNGLDDDRYSMELEISPKAEHLQLYGDRALLSRMLKNLFDNSVGHNPNGCAISLLLKSGPSRYELIVRDNGTGLSKEQLKSLEKRHAELSYGHGLGLTIVRQVVVAHGGRIKFQNGIGGGLCVSIRFSGLMRVRRTRKRTILAG